MKKFNFWDNETEELICVVAEDAIEAMEIMEQYFGQNAELLTVEDATEEDMRGN